MSSLDIFLAGASLFCAVVAFVLTEVFGRIAVENCGRDVNRPRKMTYEERLTLRKARQALYSRIASRLGMAGVIIAMLGWYQATR